MNCQHENSNTNMKRTPIELTIEQLEAMTDSELKEIYSTTGMISVQDNRGREHWLAWLSAQVKFGRTLYKNLPF